MFNSESFELGVKLAVFEPQPMPSKPISAPAPKPVAAPTAPVVSVPKSVTDAHPGMVFKPAKDGMRLASDPFQKTIQHGMQHTGKYLNETVVDPLVEGLNLPDIFYRRVKKPIEDSNPIIKTLNLPSDQLEERLKGYGGQIGAGVTSGVTGQLGDSIKNNLGSILPIISLLAAGLTGVAGLAGGAFNRGNTNTNSASQTPAPSVQSKPTTSFAFPKYEGAELTG